MAEQNENGLYMEQEEYLAYLAQKQKNKPADAETPVAQTTMYQLNKDLIRKLKRMNNMEINAALKSVYTWYCDNVSNNTVKHFALLNHEHHYFTIFEQKDEKSKGLDFIKELKDVLMNYYGDNDLRSIDVEMIDGKPSGAVEIWAMWDGEPTVAYLFPYEQGVVYF